MICVYVSRACSTLRLSICVYKIKTRTKPGKPGKLASLAYTARTKPMIGRTFYGHAQFMYKYKN